ncbi:MAG: metallophosphoesterase [Candidatus Melainabacteria bacterium]|nr:metallophosphoesterase [Candidatus Melainabacteria bacterium]
MNTQTDTTLFRLAHISDLHFSKLSWNPSQFFSKRWIGNLNLICKRQRSFAPDYLTTLFPIFHERKIDAVLITGDLTCTSYEPEFQMAQQFIEGLKQEHFKVFTLPGNHDQYTKSAFKKQLFYQFFPATYAPPTDPLSSLSLKEDGITAAYFGHGWWLLALDTAIATSLISSNGYFSPELEQKLEKALKEMPNGHQAILINHFPVFSNESSRKALLRKEALKKLLERFPKIKLFLHGHTHRHTIADLRSSHLPIMLDSGSAAQKGGGTWTQIAISAQGCEIEVFKNKWADDSLLWQSVSKSSFKW